MIASASFAERTFLGRRRSSLGRSSSDVGLLAITFCFVCQRKNVRSATRRESWLLKRNGLACLGAVVVQVSLVRRGDLWSHLVGELQTAVAAPVDELLQVATTHRYRLHRVVAHQQVLKVTFQQQLPATAIHAAGVTSTFSISWNFSCVP